MREPAIKRIFPGKLCWESAPESLVDILYDIRLSDYEYWQCDDESCYECKINNCNILQTDDCYDAGLVDIAVRAYELGLKHGVTGSTCRNLGGEEGTFGEGYDFACSSCGLCTSLIDPNFCPQCGAKVVD